MKKTIILCLLSMLMLSACSAKSAEAKTDVEVIQAKVTVKTIKLTKNEFLKKVANYETNPKEWMYLGDKPAIIDFYADWCAPCRKIAPILEELATEYEGEIYIYKVDMEVEKELATVLGIQSLPSLLFIPLDKTPQMIVGLHPKVKLKEYIDKDLLKK